MTSSGMTIESLPLIPAVSLSKIALPADPAPDHVAVGGGPARGGEAAGNLLFNPVGHVWTADACNVHWREKDRLDNLWKRVRGKQACGHLVPGD